MKTKRIYRIGIFIIIFICLAKPLAYVLIGEIAVGKVIGTEIKHTLGIKYPGKYISSVIEFEFENTKVTFVGEKNLKINYGETVSVIFLPSSPEKAKIFSFLGLFNSSLFILPFSLFVWITFFNTFKNIFDKPFDFRSKKIVEDSTKYQKTDLPKSVRLIIVGILIFFLLVILGSIVSLLKGYFNEVISLKLLLIVGGLLTFLMFFIVRDLIKKNE